jgi:hypothetical protein
MDTQKQHRNPPTNEQAPSAEAWQANVDSLQEIVCLLLIENQAMRSRHCASE